jgi:hypothetical protein
MTQTLYRFFDAEKRLLYVGISMKPWERFKQHKRQKPWWDDVALITKENYANRSAVANAERLAIKTEKPIYNIVHNASTASVQRNKSFYFLYSRYDNQPGHPLESIKLTYELEHIWPGALVVHWYINDENFRLRFFDVKSITKPVQQGSVVNYEYLTNEELTEINAEPSGYLAIHYKNQFAWTPKKFEHVVSSSKPLENRIYCFVSIWPDVMDRLLKFSRVSWMGFTESTPLSFDDGVLVVGLKSFGQYMNVKNTVHIRNLRYAIAEVAQIYCAICVKAP